MKIALKLVLSLCLFVGSIASVDGSVYAVRIDVVVADDLPGHFLASGTIVNLDRQIGMYIEQVVGMNFFSMHDNLEGILDSMERRLACCGPDDAAEAESLSRDIAEMKELGGLEVVKDGWRELRTQHKDSETGKLPRALVMDLAIAGIRDLIVEQYEPNGLRVLSVDEIAGMPEDAEELDVVLRRLIEARIAELGLGSEI